MMRFRAVAWSLGISVAATGLYLISGQVAAERGRLEASETNIALVNADMRRLRTELGTRASQRQLEQWNGEVLALSTPKANQFLQGKLQLASLDGAVLDRVAGPARLIAVNATVENVTGEKAAPRIAPPVAVAAAPAPARPVPELAANLRYATYSPDAPTTRSAVPVVRRVAFTTVTPATDTPKSMAKALTKPKTAAKGTILQTGTLASLAKAARAEGGR